MAQVHWVEAVLVVSVLGGLALLALLTLYTTNTGLLTVRFYGRSALLQLHLAVAHQNRQEECGILGQQEEEEEEEEGD